MPRVLLTLSGFGFGAAAGVAALVMPLVAAAATALALLCCFATLQHLRDDEVAFEAERHTARRFLRSGR